MKKFDYMTTNFEYLKIKLNLTYLTHFDYLNYL